MASHLKLPQSTAQKIIFRQGAVHAWIYGALAVLLGGLFLLYVVAVQCLGIFIGWGVVLTMQEVTGIEQIGGKTLSQLGFLIFASVFWLGMLRPLRRRISHEEDTIQVSVHSQPELVRTLSVLAQALGSKGRHRLLLDNAPRIESAPPDGLRAIWRGDAVIRIGLPMVSILTAREMASCLAMNLSPSVAGLGGLALRFVTGLTDWFSHSLDRDAELNPLQARPVAALQNPFKFVHGTVLWLSQRPFWILMWLGSGAGALVRWLNERDARTIGVQLIGENGLDYIAFKVRLLKKVWPGVVQTPAGDVTANFTQKALDRVTTELGNLSPFVARCNGLDTPSAAAVISHLTGETDGTALIQPFGDLAWQLMPSRYRHHLTANEGTQRTPLVRMGPTLRQVEALAVLRRYFGGLMHPERSLCGLGGAPKGDEGADRLTRAIVESRRWEAQHGSKMRTLVKEWNLAWKRCRDHHVAWAYSLAGFTVCRLDCANGLSAVEVFRREMAAQRKIMEHLEDAIRSCEVRLERRFAASLALLWGADSAVLPGRLRELRGTLPLWASSYESLSGVLPEFRELLTSFHAFQSLADRVAGAAFTGAIASAVQAVVPGLLMKAHQLLNALDGACYPFAADGIVISMRDYLAGESEILQNNGHSQVGVGMHSMVQSMISETSLAMTPMVSRFLELHHRSFAWLAATAEAAELHFVGPAELRESTGDEGQSFVHLVRPIANARALETARI